jgi:hypothetical protein
MALTIWFQTKKPQGALGGPRSQLGAILLENGSCSYYKFNNSNMSDSYIGVEKWKHFIKYLLGGAPYLQCSKMGWDKSKRVSHIY